MTDSIAVKQAPGNLEDESSDLDRAAPVARPLL